MPDGDAGLYPSSRGCTSTSLPARDQQSITRFIRRDVRDSWRTSAGPTGKERRETLSKWQDWWDRASKGRWTYHLIPNIAKWVERGHEEVNYYLTQLLSGHGYFKIHSQRYYNTVSALCPACPTTIEDAEHLFFHCPRFYEERERLQQVLQEVIEPENIVRLMLETASNWMAVASFAQSVVSRLRQEAQEGVGSIPTRRIFEVRFFAWCGRACARGGAGTTQKEDPGYVISLRSGKKTPITVRAGSDRITISRSPRRGLTKLAIDGAQHSHDEVRSENHTHKRAPDTGAKAQLERMMAPEARTTLTR
ncbi:unnamed protein product [Trichogramma brassicae]|uniref:Reverse transcriptase zinc-binding domain-containing protein n=1 Tax=Trichogramma brassicae TaxID=86971 RepID=A0A6H5I6T0_9HYME|nr:unnamed protein product [Trichogramma brassicae]